MAPTDPSAPQPSRPTGTNRPGPPSLDDQALHWYRAFVVALVRLGRRLDRAAGRLGDLAARQAPLVPSDPTRPELARQALARPELGRVHGAPGMVGVLALGAVVVLGLLAPDHTLRLAAHLAAPEVRNGGLEPLEEPSLLLGADGQPLSLVPGAPHREVVPLDDIPVELQRLVLTVEDQRFWRHQGWDGEGLVRAFLANLQAREVAQGGSTITQQLAKHNFTDGDRTVTRKARELVYAMAMEVRYDKRTILERYLNEVYLGARAYGVAAAARQYFGVEIGDLTTDQSALLAGLIQSPEALNPRVDPDAATARRNTVLRSAARAGVIGAEEAELLQHAPLELTPEPPRVVAEPLLVEAVRRELLANPALGGDRDERDELIRTGGLRIETTVDPRMQHAARMSVTQGLVDREGLGGALAAVEPGTGRVRALVSVGPPETEGLDLAAQGRRQPGSTFKTFAAAAALEAGLAPGTRLVGDGPVEIEYAEGRTWEVDNYNERNFGRLDLTEALARSVNTAFAQVGVAAGAEAIADVADRLGIDVEAALGPASERGPSLALGAVHRGVTPLEMASAYAGIAGGGEHAPPRLVDRVLDAEGEELYRLEPEREEALDPVVSGTLVQMLLRAVEAGTGGAAELDGWQVAGKTGTSQQHADGWFAGAVPVLSTAVWVGHPDAATEVEGLTGGSAAAPIWRAFMAAALDGVGPVPFPEVEGDLPEGDVELPRTRRARG